jgi:ABC-type Mn2+/Zn2+ transport system permease subunit
MLGWLTDPFASPLAQRALLEVLILSLACGPLGVWVLLYRDAYAAESMSHGMLPGLVVAALVGAPLVLGATAGVLVAAAGIALVARDERLGGDTGVAVVVSALLGLGAMLALSPETPPRLQELLFGDLLGAGDSDLLAGGLLALALAAGLASMHRPLALTAFDPSSAPGLGARSGRTEVALLVLLGLAIALAVRAVGNLLVLALLLAPAASALRLAARLPSVLAIAALIGAGSGVAGLYASYYLDIAAGASVALTAVAVFLVVGMAPAALLRPAPR